MLVISAQLPQTKKGNGEGATQQHKHLYHVGINYGFESAENGIYACCHYQYKGANPKIDAYGFEHNTACINGHRNFGEHITYNRNYGQVNPGFTVVAFFQEPGMVATLLFR